MSVLPEPPDQSRPELQSDLIDRVCDQFEAAIREGRRPRIEDFLSSFPELNQQTLLKELVGLELDLLRRNDETVTFDVQQPRSAFDGYIQRFPEAAELLKELQKDWELRIANKCDPVTPSAGFDPEVETLDHDGYQARRNIKQFELQSILGRGGFGIVWRARDKRLQRDVAIKVPRADRLAVSDRTMFLREARAAAKLRHPNIIAIHDVGEDDSAVFIVSELIDGVSLKVWLESHKIAPNEAAQLIAKLAKAVQHAHDKKIVHRDLKPANVLMDQQGEPHVADFGLAKRDTGEESLSINGQIMGTPAYMSPEQAYGDHSAIDARTDVYALGAIFYELLTGVRPFRGEMGLLLEQVKTAIPEAPRQIKPEIPRDLEAICLKCLAKDRAKRYASAAALAEDLHLYLAGETLRGIPAALPNRVWKWFNRHRRFVTAIGLTFFVALTAAGGLAWQFRGTKPPPVDLREVEFVTEPEGCEITVVALDPQSGEPDPNRIEHATGLTPLVMNLAPADYLVVAVLDDTRFHEVLRHVPARDETTPHGDQHLSWRLNSSGQLKVKSIMIPRSDVTLGMGLVEKGTRVSEPNASGQRQPRVWQVPSFYVDPHEQTMANLRGFEDQKRKLAEPVAARNPNLLQARRAVTQPLGNFGRINHHLERIGKRLPSAAELYYLSMLVCPKSDENEKLGAGSSGCVLADRTVIEGVHAGVWEWTSTKPGGPFGIGSSSIDASGTAFLMRVLMCGSPGENGDKRRNFGELRIGLEPLEQAGGRGVRSARPRRKPQDFVSPVALSTQAGK